MFHRRVELHLHFVWSTWDRVGWVDPSLRARIHGVIASTARRERCRPVFVGGTDDHVHVLLRAPPTVTPSVLVGKLKGVSSHAAHEWLGVDPSLRWSEGYALFSVATRDVDALAAYVVDQERRHGLNITDSAWELPDLNTHEQDHASPQHPKGR